MIWIYRFQYFDAAKSEAPPIFNWHNCTYQYGDPQNNTKTYICTKQCDFAHKTMRFCACEFMLWVNQMILEKLRIYSYLVQYYYWFTNDDCIPDVEIVDIEWPEDHHQIQIDDSRFRVVRHFIWKCIKEYGRCVQISQVCAWYDFQCIRFVQHSRCAWIESRPEWSKPYCVPEKSNRLNRRTTT